ncbi:carboxy-S-adenosyl-L-methionine synthase CmoA [Glaciecola sp. 1036]|uniref:carboxy-S-adenosyl-L-methionine synthase CmoA n=1 Tax=Alteromonadaceae TaxID=72275 RepID=UPI003D081A50
MKNIGKNPEKDQLFAAQRENIAPFSFDQNVADVFPDMINRSVPGYQKIISTIPEIIASHLKNTSIIYDIGCSLGATSLAIAKRFNQSSIQIKALDYSEAMVERCKKNISAWNFNHHIEVIYADVTKVTIAPCDAIIMNFTLQFISPNLRQDVIDKLYSALNPGGILVVSEKLSFKDTLVNNKLIEIHHEFKRQNGYSDLEISQKRTALENVMITDNQDGHYARFKQAGFSHYASWYQNLNFASMFAIK